MNILTLDDVTELKVESIRLSTDELEDTKEFLEAEGTKNKLMILVSEALSIDEDDEDDFFKDRIKHHSHMVQTSEEMIAIINAELYSRR